jgi:hypothetical protein
VALLRHLSWKTVPRQLASPGSLLEPVIKARSPFGVPSRAGPRILSELGRQLIRSRLG